MHSRMRGLCFLGRCGDRGCKGTGFAYGKYRIDKLRDSVVKYSQIEGWLCGMGDGRCCPERKSGRNMGSVIGVGILGFEKIRRGNCFDVGNHPSEKS